MQSSGDPEQDHKRIADLLKHGAHTLHHENEANQEEAKFEQESIDAILNGRTEKRQLGSRKGNTFSTANFAFQDVGVSTFKSANKPSSPGLIRMIACLLSPLKYLDLDTLRSPR